MEFAYAVKRGNAGAAIRAGMKALAQALVDRGAGSIVAACTEVPLVLSANEVAVPLIESTDALARKTVAIALGEAPLPSRDQGDFE
jgi:aspartate racemase